MIVDAHFDIAYNVTRGRDPRMPAREQPLADNEIATVGLPDLREGGVGESLLEKITCPLGLPIGGNDPHEIAISIAAQLLAARDTRL